MPTGQSQIIPMCWSHIIYKYSNESDPYFLIVFYSCLILPFCIPFLVCYFGLFPLGSPHLHDSSPFPPFVLIVPIFFQCWSILRWLWLILFYFHSKSSDFSYFCHLFSSSCISAQVCYTHIDRWPSHLCFVILILLPHSYVPSCIKGPL